ncbi:MAG: hypothetical protein EZS28_048019 [Streblomastix strix]|uniref:Uncharacterized protein n=1 Tax=Streblomastix strix TaxID=222440 RepID=A0A5J4TDG4_9EUKA|nr:MAG: hypothetical protein EZS28_048019 [Streblomastix strix]
MNAGYDIPLDIAGYDIPLDIAGKDIPLVIAGNDIPLYKFQGMIQLSFGMTAEEDLIDLVTINIYWVIIGSNMKESALAKLEMMDLTVFAVESDELMCSEQQIYQQ